MSCCHVLTFLNSAMFAGASEPLRNLSAHIGARTATRAVLVSLTAICLAVLPSIHPPQPKPMSTVASAPAQAPCNRRVMEGPSRIAGNDMTDPFARHLGARTTDARMGSGLQVELKGRPL